MKICALFVFFFLAISVSGHAAQEVGGRSEVSIPGTGITVVPPPGMYLGVVGTELADKTRGRKISFRMSTHLSDIKKQFFIGSVFPEVLEHFETAHLSGDLYRHTHVNEEGKNADNWLWIVSRGQQHLAVHAYYEGDPQESLEYIRDVFSTIRWNSSPVDPELALGIRLFPPGFHSVPDIFGSLIYNKSGKVEDDSATLVVVYYGEFSSGDDDLDFLCGNFFKAYFKAHPDAVLEKTEFGDVRVCEMWNPVFESESHRKYMALIQLSGGPVFMAMGKNTLDGSYEQNIKVFREGVKSLKYYPLRGVI